MNYPLSIDQLTADLKASRRTRVMFRERWERSGPKCGGCWKLDIGGQVDHCGHPTANWPYAGISRRGKSILLPNGLGFQILITAQIAVFCQSLAEFLDDGGQLA